tara:strand:+ start:458 stop:682 length:225 start_codon:yes stop_codon:yes gene_type:complete
MRDELTTIQTSVLEDYEAQEAQIKKIKRDTNYRKLLARNLLSVTVKYVPRGEGAETIMLARNYLISLNDSLNDL